MNNHARTSFKNLPMYEWYPSHPFSIYLFKSTLKSHFLSQSCSCNGLRGPLLFLHALPQAANSTIILFYLDCFKRPANLWQSLLLMLPFLLIQYIGLVMSIWTWNSDQRILYYLTMLIRLLSNSEMLDLLTLLLMISVALGFSPSLFCSVIQLMLHGHLANWNISTVT